MLDVWFKLNTSCVLQLLHNTLSDYHEREEDSQAPPELEPINLGGNTTIHILNLNVFMFRLLNTNFFVLDIFFLTGAILP